MFGVIKKILHASAFLASWILWAWYNNFEGVVWECPLLRGKFVLTSHIGILNLVRCPETRSVRFSEVVYAI